jgi:hypothetical protein
MHNPLEQPSDRRQAGVERLRGLPAELEPPYNWQEFQRRSHLRSDEGGLDWRHMAAAAVFLLVVCGVAVWGRIGIGERHTSPGTRDSAETAMHRSSGSRDITVGDVDALRARAIESWLETLPREPAVVRVGTRADIARLEDRIAQVDDLLTSVRLEGERPDRLAALQRERFRLVGSLAQVRYAEFLASESP